MPNLTFTKIAKFSAPARIGIFILTLLLVWVPLAAPIYFLVENVNNESILAIAILYKEGVGSREK